MADTRYPTPFHLDLECAARLAVRERRRGGVTASTLCRCLHLSWEKAQAASDLLESAGILGPFDGIKPRPVLVDDEDQAVEMIMNHINQSEKS